jgi:hypothetical protein
VTIAAAVIRQFSDNDDFRKWLEDTIFSATYAE